MQRRIYSITTIVVGVFILAAVSLGQAADSGQRLRRAGLELVAELPSTVEETDQLGRIFAESDSALALVPAGPDAGAERRGIEGELRSALADFVVQHPQSGWTPSIHVLLGRLGRLRVAYSEAMDHDAQAWALTRDLADPVARRLARQAAGSLGQLLALTGRLGDLDLLEGDVRRSGLAGTLGSDWRWALELRRWATRNPGDAYKCGLHSLELLGRLTQPGAFRPRDIVETESSTNGFSVADLLTIAERVGLRVQAGLLTDMTELPVPSVMHLRS